MTAPLSQLELICLQGAECPEPSVSARRFSGRDEALAFIATLPGYRQLDTNLWERNAEDFLVLRNLNLN